MAHDYDGTEDFNERTSQDRARYIRACEQWAEQRWLWVDPSLIGEIAGQEYDNRNPRTPMEFIDAEADANDLIDPFEKWGVKDTLQDAADLIALKADLMEAFK